MRKELAATLLGVILALTTAGRGGASTPNLVVVVADDLGWNDVGYHGSELSTPALDALAAQGIALDRFYSHPMCTPTRSALLTGRHPHRLGMSNGVLKPNSLMGLPLGETTIADRLREAGYFTVSIGKWHLGHAQGAYLPRARGFDHHYGHYLGQIDYFDHTLSGGLDWHRNGVPVREEGYATDLLGAEAERLIRSHDFQRPIFMLATFNAPHTPLQAKREDIALFDHMADPGRRVYAAQVYALDRAVGGIVDALRDAGQWQRTVFLFFSDNGGATQDQLFRGDNRPLRGAKGTLYDGGVRVPAILVENGLLGSHAERLGRVPLGVADVAPTLAQIAGAPIAGEAIDGRSWLELARDPAAGRRELLVHLDDYSGAIVFDHHKLVVNGARKGSGVPFYDELELFDLAADPFERRNLAVEKPGLTDRGLALLKAHEAHKVASVLDIVSTDLSVPAVWGAAESGSLALDGLARLRETVFLLDRRYVLAAGFFAGAVVAAAVLVLLLWLVRSRRRPLTATR